MHYGILKTELWSQITFISKSLLLFNQKSSPTQVVGDNRCQFHNLRKSRKCTTKQNDVNIYTKPTEEWTMRIMMPEASHFL